MLPFTVQIKDGLPVSDQILHAVRKALLTNQLRQGDLFPSVRHLSQELRISPTTAHKVVAQLKQTGFLASRPGVGMVIAAPDLPPRDERIKHLLPLCRQLLRETGELHLHWADLIEALRKTADEFPHVGGPSASFERESVSHETDY